MNNRLIRFHSLKILKLPVWQNIRHQSQRRPLETKTISSTLVTSVFRRHNVGSNSGSAQGSAWVDPGLIHLWGAVPGSTLDYPWIYPGTTLTNTRLYIGFISTLHRLGWPG